MEVGLISVCVILIVFAVGFFFNYKKILPDNSSLVLSKVIVLISAPALAITSIYSRFTITQLKHSIILLLIGLAHLLILFIVSKVFSKVLKLTPKKKEIFEVTFTFSNTIFIGLPVTKIVFSHEGLPYMFTYYIVLLILFWSLGAYKIMKLSEKEGPKKKITLTKIINPGLLGCIIGSLLVITQLRLHPILNISLSYLGDLTVPLSLICIGWNLFAIFKEGVPKIEKADIVILICKFILSPLLMFGLLTLFHIDGLPRAVLVFICAMPCHMQTSILAEAYDVESKFASKLVGISTVCYIFILPIIVVLLKNTY